MGLHHVVVLAPSLLLLLACGGAGAEGTKAKTSTSSAAPGKSSPPDPEALAYDCATLEKALASFAPPAEDVPDGSAIASSYQSAAVSLRTSKLETADVRDTSKRMAELFDKIAANGATIEKDFRALHTAAEGARERVASFENAVAGADATCSVVKVKDPACPAVTKVLATHPVLRRGDAQDPTAYVAKLGAFRKDVAALRPENGQVKHMLEVVDEHASAIEKNLADMKAVRTALDQHSLSDETKAISGRLDALCPAKKKAGPPAP
jgi:hypothetical protein